MHYDLYYLKNAKTNISKIWTLLEISLPLEIWITSNEYCLPVMSNEHSLFVARNSKTAILFPVFFSEEPGNFFCMEDR